MKSLLVTVLIALSLTSMAQQKETLCEVKVEGQEFVLHLVEVGENLFRISQKYNSRVDDIWEVNPSLVDNTIIPGQVIKVPRNSKLKEAPKPVAIGKDNAGGVTVITTAKPLDPKQLVYHEVEAKQTLFSISRQYNVSVEDIMSWNKLGGFDISIGDKLIVSAYGELKVIDNETEEVKLYTPSEKPIRTSVNVNSKQDILYKNFLGDKSSGKKLNRRRGTAGKLVSNNPNAKDAYYALHKSAPVGSIIKVVNLVNRKYVFVKVLAPLPDIDENKNIEVKISPAASKEIVLLDGKSLVEISYYE